MSSGQPADSGLPLQGPQGIPEPPEEALPSSQATLEQAWRRLMQRYSKHNIKDLQDAGVALASMRTLRRTL